MRLTSYLLAGALGGILLAVPVSAATEAASPAATAAPAATATAPLKRLEVLGEEKIPHRSELDNVFGVTGWQVNGEEVPISALYDMAMRYHGPYLLQDLVARKLLEQAAKEEGVTITEADVDAEVKSLRERTGMIDDEPFQRWLQSQRTTPEGYRETARLYAYIRKIVGRQVRVTDDEIASVYNRERETTYRRPEIITVKIAGGANEKNVAAALARVKGGAEFSTAVKTVAEGPEDVAGGEVAYLRGQKQYAFPPQLETALFNSPVKQWVGPLKVDAPAVNGVRAPASYVFFRVEAKADAHQFTLEEVRDTIRNRLLQRKVDEAYPDWLGAHLRAATITPLRAN